MYLSMTGLIRSNLANVCVFFCWWERIKKTSCRCQKKNIFAVKDFCYESQLFIGIPQNKHIYSALKCKYIVTIDQSMIDL